MSGPSPSLRELIDIDELQSIQDSFARAIGISSVILSPEGEPLTKFANPTGFCSLIQSTEKGKERCFRSFMEMGEIALLSEEAKILRCFAHGWHFVAPIMVDGEHKGTVFVGQFIPEKFSSEQLEDLKKIALEIDLDPGLLVKEAGKIRVIREDVIRNYSIPIFLIVEIITKRGAQAAELIRANDALQVAHDELERRVQERTSELAESNEVLTREIAERKRVGEALKNRVEFEKIITTISTGFINLAPDEVDAGIEDALGIIGEFSGVNRSYLFQFFDDKTKMDNTHGWCARGIVPQIGNLKGLQTADFPWLMGKFNRFETVHIPSVADLPPEAGAEKETLQSQDILSAILVPMIYGGTLIGYLGFDSVRQEKSWSEDNIALLKIVGEIFVNALEHMRASDAIRSSEAKFHAIFEENPLGAAIIDKNRKIMEVNDTAAALIGRPREDIIGRICHEFICPRAQNDCPIYDHGLTFDHEDAILLSKDRGEVPIRKTVTQITIDDEPALLEVFYDITRRKTAEEALRESEEKYRTIYDSSKDAIMMATPEEGFLSGNPATIEMFGCKDEKEFISRTPYDLSPQYQPDGKLSSEKAEQMMAIAMKKGSHFFEWIHKRMDGKEFPTTVLLTRMELQGRRVLQATVRDITEQKAAENSLRESEEKYRSIIENIQEVFYRADMKGNLVMASPSGAKLLGYDSVEEMMGLNVAKTFYAVPEERDEFLKVLGKKGVVNGYEITLKKTDGTLVPAWVSSHFYFDKSGNPLGVEGILSDITERKRAEQEIENLQRYNRGLIEVSLDPLVTFDHKGIILDVNRAMIQATGRTREELIGTPFADYFTDPERAYKGAMLAFEIEGVRDYELVMKTRDGTETIVSYNTSIYRDQTGDVVGAFAAARDITERKAAEAEIKKKVEELKGFNKLAVGRELKMIELKKEINTLLEDLGREPGYKLVGES